jgi:hypothetical protein
MNVRAWALPTTCRWSSILASFSLAEPGTVSWVGRLPAVSGRRGQKIVFARSARPVDQGSRSPTPAGSDGPDPD